MAVGVRNVDSTERVVLVNGRIANLSTLAFLLGESGYATRMLEASAAVVGEVADDLPDLVFLDDAADPANALDVCQRLRDDPRTHWIPIVLVVDGDVSAAWSEVRRCGADDYVTKPYHAAEVLPRVKTHVALGRTMSRLMAVERDLERVRRESETGPLAHVGSEPVRDALAPSVDRRRTDGRYQRLIESVEDDLIFFSRDAEGRFIDVSPSVTSVLGYSIEAFLEKQDAIFWRDKRACGPPPREDGVSRGDGPGVREVEILHEHGDVRTLGLREFLVWSDEGKILAVEGVAQDITAHRRAERVHAALLRLNEFAAEHPVKELLREFLDEAEKLTDSEIGFFHFLSDDQETISLQMWSTNTLESGCRTPEAGMHYPMSKAGVWVDCVRVRGPVVHNDYASLSHRKGLPEGHAPVVRELVVPVLRGDRIVAILGVGNKRSLYTDGDARTIQRLADLCWETVVRKRAEEALRDSELRFRELFESMTSGVAVLEPVDGGNDFLIGDLNSSGSRMLQLAIGEHVGKPLSDVLPRVREMSLWTVLQKARETGDRTEQFVERYADDRIAFWGSFSVFRLPAGHVCIVWEDISDEKRMHDELETHRHRLEEIVEERTRSLRNAMSELRATQESAIQMEKMADLGRLASCVAHEINNPMGAIIASCGVLEQSARKTADALRSSDQAGANDLVGEFFAAVLEASGPPERARDRREKRERLLAAMEEHAVDDARALAEAFVQLGVADQLDRFVPLLHDQGFRNVVDVALNLVGMLRSAEIIETAAKRAAKIVYALRNYAQPASVGDMRRVSVCKSIEDVVFLYRSKIEENIEVVREIAPNIVIIAHAEELHQLWMNLIHNAMEAMGYRGKLTLRVRRAEDGVLIQIADTGCGMSSEVQDRMFEPFFTTKRTGEGCGLGMDIVKRIVDHHHGRLHIESEPDAGTTVTVTLPLEPPHGAVVRPPTETSEHAATE